MKKAVVTRVVRVVCMLAVAFAVTSVDAIAQRRPLPPDPRNPFRDPPTPGEVRSKSAFVSVHAGLASPGGDLGKLASPGPALGVGVGYWLGSQFALRLRTDIERPGGDVVTAGPSTGQEIDNWIVYSIDAGGTVDLTGGEGPVLLGIDLGVGGTMIDSGEFGSQSLNQWFVSVTPGLVFGRSLGSRVTFTADLRYRFLFGNDDDLEALLADSASTLGDLQLQAGFQFLVGSR